MYIYIYIYIFVTLYSTVLVLSKLVRSICFSFSFLLVTINDDDSIRFDCHSLIRFIRSFIRFIRSSCLANHPKTLPWRFLNWQTPTMGPIRTCRRRRRCSNPCLLYSPHPPVPMTMTMTRTLAMAMAMMAVSCTSDIQP